MPAAKPAAPAKEPPRRKAPDKKTVQKKLAVGASGDRFEREADQVARRAVSGAEGAARIPPTISALGVQRAPLPPAAKQKPKDSASERQDQRKAPVQRKAASPLPRVEEDKKPGARAQRDATDSGGAGVAPASVESSIGRMQAGGGNALDGGARSMMESRLGHDFSGVRVHHDSGAASAAQALHSRAFTVGRDVFFNAGEYRPHTTSGRELIAHELTHTVQQAGTSSGARKKVQRTPTPGTGTTSPQQVEDQNQAAPPSMTTFTSTRLPGATLDATPSGTSRGTITLPVLGLPRIAGALKGTAGGQVTPVADASRAIPAVGASFPLGPVPARDDSKAYETWETYARDHFKTGVRAKLGTMLAGTTDVPALSGTGGTDPVYVMRFQNSAQHAFIGTLDELAGQSALLRPQWNPSGAVVSGPKEGLQADHFLELQIGGKDGGDNMWLLRGQYNGAVGNQLKNKINADLTTLLTEIGSNPIQKPVNPTEAKRFWTIRFATVAEGTGYEAPTPVFWTPTQITAGTHLEKLKFMNEADLVAAGLRLSAVGARPTQIRVFPTPAGGRLQTVRLNPQGEVIGANWLFPNLWVVAGTYFDAATDEGQSKLASLTVTMNKQVPNAANPLGPMTKNIDVLRDPRLGIAGVVSRDSLKAAFGTLDFSGMSPLTFGDLGLNSEGLLVGTGSIAATKALFPGLNVPIVLYGDRIMMTFPIPTENLSLGPLSVTEAALSLGVGGQGLFIEGYAGFMVNGLGSGTVTAELDRAGPRLSGAFNFTTDFFTPAQVTASYDLATDTLTAGGTLGVAKGKIPGVESGTVTVLVSRDRLDFNGTISLAAPLAGTVINVGYTREQGLRIGADNIPLPFASLPAVQKATMSIAATRTPEGVWSFAGTGTATLAVPGATGTINLVYLDGRITMTAAAAVAKGPASGTLNFTATNAPMDEQGNPVDGPPRGTITVWGRGTVTIRFGNILTGTAGIELTQDNRVILNGTIGLPPVFEVFARRDYNKDLLHLEPPEFPIWGVSVAGVGVGVFAFVDARVAFEAHVGAGVIRDAAITAEMDLDHPELATVHGHGEFFVPAYAGLTLDVGGGLRARAAVAYAQGRVGLQGTLGIQADASAALDVDWNPTSGLAVETRVAANVRPKFRLAANASVTIGVDLLVTEVSHTFGPWQRTLGEFGPDMELGVEFPVRWSEANGLDLSLDNIVIRQPTLDAPALMSSVFDALAP